MGYRVYGQANHLGMQTATQANSASYPQRNEYGQSAVMLGSWTVKAGWLIQFVDKRVGLTCHTRVPGEMSVRSRSSIEIDG